MAAASLVLVGAPYCPAGHSQSECDALWAASHAVAATQNQSDNRSISAGATAYLAARETAAPPTILPTAARMKMLYQVTDLVSQLAGGPVVLQKAIYFSEGEGLLCGAGLIGSERQTFYFGGGAFKRNPSRKEMTAVGCFQGGGVLIADY